MNIPCDWCGVPIIDKLVKVDKDGKTLNMHRRCAAESAPKK